MKTKKLTTTFLILTIFSTILLLIPLSIVKITPNPNIPNNIIYIYFGIITRVPIIGTIATLFNLCSIVFYILLLKGKFIKNNHILTFQIILFINTIILLILSFVFLFIFGQIEPY